MKITLGIALIMIGIAFSVPAIRLIIFVFSVNGSDINISGINVVIIASALGGASLVGGLWSIASWRRDKAQHLGGTSGKS